MGKKVKRPKASLVTHLEMTLQRHGPLTLRQISRHLGVKQAQVRLLHRQGVVRIKSFLLRRSGGAHAAKWWEVAALAGKRFPAARLMAHHLGLAETRLALLSRFSEWNTLRDQRDEWRKWELYDAVARDADNRATLIEYDAGTHTWARVLAKVETGRRLMVKQLWATSSPQRAWRLASLCPDLEVWVIDWLDGHAYCISSPDRPPKGSSLVK